MGRPVRLSTVVAFNTGEQTHLWRQLPVKASCVALLAWTASFEGSHGIPVVFPVWRIFWTTVGGIASVGAARAALDA